MAAAGSLRYHARGSGQGPRRVGALVAALGRSPMRHKLLASVGLGSVMIAAWLILLLGAVRPAWGQSSRGRKVIRLEAIKVEGRIQKPQAFYILQRSNLNFEGLELRQSFVPKIVKSIDNEPF